jgi:hypothetical protein
MPHLKNLDERDSMSHINVSWLEEIVIQTKESIDLVKKEKLFFSFRSHVGVYHPIIRR